MKLAFIFPRFSGPYGGERLVLRLVGELKKFGHEATIFTHQFDDSCNELIDKKTVFNCKTFSTTNHNLATLFSFHEMPRLVEKINSTFDLICGMGWQSTYALYLLKDMYGIPLVYHCLEPPRFLYDLKKETLKTNIINKFLIKGISPNIKKIDYKAVRSLDNIIAISDWTRDQLKKIYNKESVVVYPGVEVERFKKYSKQEAKEKQGFLKYNETYVTISKLHKRKKINKAIEVFIKRSYKENNRFYIIGNGPERDNLKKLVIKEGFDKKIIFLSGLSDDQVALYLMAADYFIFTAKNEPFGIAPLEAKAAGCKIIPEDFVRPVLTWEESARKEEEVFKNLISHE